jgi:hypothetical protein
MYNFDIVNQSHSWETNSRVACQEIPAFVGTQNFITPFTNLSISLEPEMRWLSQYTLIVSLVSSIILSSHTSLRLGHDSGLFSSGIPTDILKVFIVPPMPDTCSAHSTIHHHTHWNMNLTQLLDESSKDKDFNLPIVCCIRLVFSNMQTDFQLRFQVKMNNKRGNILVVLRRLNYL